MTEYDEIKQSKKNQQKFRGQFMDMKHVSSDMLADEKPNRASEMSVKSKTSKYEEASNFKNPKPENSIDFTESEKVDKGVFGVFASSIDSQDKNKLDKITEKDSEFPAAEFIDKKESSQKDNPQQSPFLENVNIEKRPLGSPLSEKNFDDDINIKDELLDSDLNQKQLPVDDGDKGILVSALSTSEESDFFEKKDPEPDRLPRANAQGKPGSGQEENMRAAIDSSMIFKPQRANSDANDIPTPDSPFANSAITPKPSVKPIKKKKSSMITWILMIILLLAAGGATGALIYLHFPELLSWLNF